MKYVLLILSFWNASLFAQDNPFIKLVSPVKEKNDVAAPKQFIVGATCKGCFITINDEQVKVFETGSFGLELKLDTGITAFNIISTNAKGKKLTKTVSYNYSLPKPTMPVSTPEIASVQTFPEGNLILKAGDKIRFKVKALPGCNISTINNTPLFEIPINQSGGMPGIYQGEYEVKQADNFSAQPFVITMQTKDGQTITQKTKSTFAVMSPLASDIAITKGRLAYLEYGLGDDRLGGAKMGYLDENIPVKIIGKVAGDYKIQLTKNKVAYIPDELVSLAPVGTQAGYSLTGNWRVYGDSVYDYLTVSLSTKLPYQSVQQINPSKIVVDLFGAVNNTNWITQLQTAKEIENVDYEQVADDIYRIHIYLKHKQHWGHKIYYNGTNLVIRVKQQPEKPSLKHLTVAVDAGHGGANEGAYGPSGSSEKMLTLDIAKLVKQHLEAEGAKVLMTRETEKFVDNKERILLYRDNEPDLLISIHLNSATDPFKAGGTSSFYRHVGFRPLSFYIHKRMIELGLKEYGNVGSFNFMLNSPTEYPNALVETLFISNLEEEALISNPEFRHRMAEKIVKGIKDFLESTKD